MKKRYYPLYLDIKGKRCVVAGSGNVARRKIKRLREFGAKVFVVNPYKKKCLRGAELVFATTDNLSVNRQIVKDAKEMGILVNVAKPASCGDFILPAIFEKDGFIISISTNGKSPKKAKGLKEKLYEFFSSRD